MFGSRTNDDALGGDIDVMIVTNTKIEKSVFRTIRVEFYKKFGWQMIDFINFRTSDESAFK